ncbi:guanine nucleotide exchange factor for Rab-3A-like [Octopus sinensis]|uniref:Guanine nucleotide exchange factor for Rab-3A-like n=1 Tax=Octopus sinensis TaxID=2607531 RepID=A0A6P7TTG6_9MOLL|nr:guanine nucleotide exchange factor for Rab-3A-like [Octopus sinensis]
MSPKLANLFLFYTDYKNVKIQVPVTCSFGFSKIEVLQAEVTALKTLVLTSTPSTPNKHLHPQIDTTSNKKKESSRPFWKTHRRSTSHHEFTKETRGETDEGENGHTTQIDLVCFEEFCQWREQSQQTEQPSSFLSRVFLEDISPCLNFSNTNLSERVKKCVDNNTLTIEPIASDSSYPRWCTLSQSNKLCNYKIHLGEDHSWYSISEFCRNRITSVCNFYTYIRYIQQGLVKGEDKSVFLEVLNLRKKMALARLGYS